MKKQFALYTLAVLFPMASVTFGQEYPKFEVPGGGLDFALTKHIQARPVEVDYLYTRFGINGTSYTGAQNNFKYFAGVNFVFGQ